MMNIINMMDTITKIQMVVIVLFLVSLGVYQLWLHRTVRAVIAPALLLGFTVAGCVYFSANLEPKEQTAVRELFVQGLMPVAIVKEFDKNPPSRREWNSSLIDQWLQKKIAQQLQDPINNNTSPWLEQHWASGGMFLKNSISNTR